jgi:hypothetical protein
MGARIQELIDFLGNGTKPTGLSASYFRRFEQELNRLEGCGESCYQEVVDNRQKVEDEILKYAATKVALDEVTKHLHYPSSAQFEGVVYNKNNGAVCGQLTAMSQSGRRVRESFAVDGNGKVTIGYSPDRKVNLGAIAAERLCAVQR